MGLERRGNNFYYYEKRREGNRVVSVYCGKGEIAKIQDQLSSMAREEQAKNRAAEMSERSNLESVDQLIDASIAEAEPLVEALYLVKGYHKHTRTWRRKQDAEER
jgi:hypothetical protein